MLNINMEGSRAYAQHIQLYFHVFHSFSLNTRVSTHVLQRFFLNTNHQSLKCSRASRSTQIINSSSAPELPTHTNHQSLKCSRDSRSTQNISSMMCFRFDAQHKQGYIYISTIIGLRPIYKTNHHAHMQWGFRPDIYKNKISRQNHKQ